MSTEPITLDLIARKLDRVLTEQADMRDQMTVQTAILMRLEASVHALEIEVRALRGRLGRLGNRVRALENAAPPS
jgi:hypothetical protein